MRMKWILRFSGVCMLTTVLSACNFFAPQQTAPLELLENNPAATEIAALRATATAETDRMMITLESAQTAVRAVDVQSTRIASTLIARGTPFIDISQITPNMPTSFTFAGVDNSGALDPSVQALVTPGGGAQGNSAVGTAINPPSIVVGTPTALPGVDSGATENTSASVLSSITLSRAVGADDCPTQPDTLFTPDDTDIYVTAVAQGLLANSAVRALFSRDGVEAVAYDWIPSFNIDGACIWFYMPSSSVAYVPGNWNVQLTINGVNAGSATFTIEGAMTESTG